MSVLFGHPTGNPNSHNAAMAYLEAGLLECCCVSWMPSAKTIDVLKSFRRLRPLAQRLERRQFPALSQVPKVQDRVREIYRLLMRALALRTYPPDYVNRWLMRTMIRECCRSTVTTVHAYEDCSLWPFIKAKRLNKACVYDLPSPFYPPWEIQVELSRKYSDWMPSNCWPAAYDLTLQQKRRAYACRFLGPWPRANCGPYLPVYMDSSVLAPVPT